MYLILSAGKSAGVPGQISFILVRPMALRILLLASQKECCFAAHAGDTPIVHALLAADVYLTATPWYPGTNKLGEKMYGTLVLSVRCFGYLLM